MLAENYDCDELWIHIQVASAQVYGVSQLCVLVHTMVFVEWCLLFSMRNCLLPPLPSCVARKNCIGCWFELLHISCVIRTGTSTSLALTHQSSGIIAFSTLRIQWFFLKNSRHNPCRTLCTFHRLHSWSHAHTHAWEPNKRTISCPFRWAASPKRSFWH